MSFETSISIQKKEQTEQRIAFVKNDFTTPFKR
jgi:hypothetical protein